jgi:hypothetical protein
MSQRAKLKQFHQAVTLMKRGKTQMEACSIAGISRMTYNKYKDMLGEEIAPGQYEVIPEAPVAAKKDTVTSKQEISQMSDLDRLQLENAALLEQLKLRQELAKFMH